MPHRALRSFPTKDATDLTDEPGAALAPLVVTLPSNGRRPTDIDRRAIVNALLSNVNALLSKHRTARQWHVLPTDVPPMSSVWYYFDKWNRDGTFVKIIHDIIRFSYLGSIAMLLNRLPPRCSFLIKLLQPLVKNIRRRGKNTVFFSSC